MWVHGDVLSRNITVEGHGGSTLFGLRFLNASWLGSVRSGSVRRPVLAGYMHLSLSIYIYIYAYIYIYIHMIYC